MTRNKIQECIVPTNTVKSRKCKPSLPRNFKIPPRFPLLDKEFYSLWCNHKKEMQLVTHLVDDAPPKLFTELYLKPRRFNFYAHEMEAMFNVNKDLLKRINVIQRTGGFVDCWRVKHPLDSWYTPEKRYAYLCKKRQKYLDRLYNENMWTYSRILTARSEQLTTRELNDEWKVTKDKLILGARLPFILFKTEQIDRGFKDPAFENPSNAYRPRVSLEIWIANGSKVGKVVVELFSDIAPRTCQLFMTLIRGDGNGHSYKGTRFFRVVPNLYCRGGDVVMDNGFGCYNADTEAEAMVPENFTLKHTVPGILSMVANGDNEICGQFNIIFKPLPQFDGIHTVFGRLVGGPTESLERIGAVGLPLGSTSSDCVIRNCGWYNRSGRYRPGTPNTIEFPPRSRQNK